MKKPFLNLIVILILIIGSVLLLQTNFVHAEDTNPGIISSAIRSAVNPILADFANLTMTTASWALIFAGAVLDVSIKLTLNIKDFVNATPAIFTVWKTLRDITGLFFIFYLLFAAIQMMTGLGKGSYGSTIKNIVIAGVLINFSFFIVSIGIDVSNITSQAIYNAMVPNSQTIKFNEKTGLAEIVRDNGQSKISNIFMNSLRIQKIYDTKGNRLGTNITDPIKIVLIGITGVIMMLTAAASLILAALAFIARLVILLFLLAFSSLWFAGKVIPQVKEQVKMFEGAFYSQLIFMPVYLLLMYVALSIINGSNFFSAGDIDGVASTITGPNWIMPYIIIGVNFAIVIFILNLPLVIGLSMGSHATDWLKKSIGKWDAGKVWGSFGGGVSGFAGVHTIGRLASSTDKALGNTRIGNSAIGRSIRSNTTGTLAKSKFLGNETWEDKTKAAKERAKKGAEIKRKIEFNETYRQARSGIPPVVGGPSLKSSLDKMTTSEKLALGVDKLKDFNILKHLKSRDFEAIKDDKEGLFTDQEKKDIFDKRGEALADAIKNSEDSIIKNMVGEMEGKDLLKVSGIKVGGNSILINPDVIKHMKTSQLQKMGDEGLDATIKDNIKNQILALGPTGHSAHSWIRKNWR